MSIRLEEEDDRNVPANRVSGKPIRRATNDRHRSSNASSGNMQKNRMLLDMTRFHGCEASAAWQDLKLDLKHHAHIERAAMVGEKKWQQVMATVCKLSAKATIRSFDHSAAPAARRWLHEAARQPSRDEHARSA